MSPPTSVSIEFASASEVLARSGAGERIDWLWHGYLAGANVTLLVGPWKAGKTTLLSVVLARLGTGGSVAGRAVRPGRAVVVSEEAHEVWSERIARLGIGDQLHLVSRPFRGRPTVGQWTELIDTLAARHRERPFDLLVIDPLAAFLASRTENHAGTMLDLLLPLQELTRAGVCVLVLHHPSKRPGGPGQMARGSGALTGAADIILELELMTSAADDDRRRRLSGFSRLSATPRRLVIELTEDGTDYVALGDFQGHDFTDHWPILSGVLEEADGKLTRKQILGRWPEDYVKPSPMALWRWLDRAVKEKRLLVEGTGRRSSPFVYWLDGMEEVWASDPWRMPLEPLPDLRKSLAEVLGERLLRRREQTRREEEAKLAARNAQAAEQADGEPSA